VTDLTGFTPESWVCIDCGINTWPGCPSRIEMERRYDTAAPKTLTATGEELPIAEYTVTDLCEVYTVRSSVWAAAGMEPYGGCLCIGCLEKRLGRKLTPKDFMRRHPFNHMLGTARLLERRDGAA
jgi:hypothetical protein